MTTNADSKTVYRYNHVHGQIETAELLLECEAYVVVQSGSQPIVWKKEDWKRTRQEAVYDGLLRINQQIANLAAIAAMLQKNKEQS